MKEITVGLDSYRLEDPFKVKGFSVKGRVLTGPGGAPIAEAKVILIPKLPCNYKCPSEIFFVCVGKRNFLSYY